ncbi:MAG: radical SAM protein, partial [Thermoplasmata archaeon]|nr:radical SAM protein [Thermoplasmata archaeon]
MAQIKRLEKGSGYRGTLPKGCAQCREGRKLVLLVTGLCTHKCYYCPLSSKKRGKDVFFADEMSVRKYEDILKEARLIDATGTGVTGGDPLAALNRTIRSIMLVKREFGSGHHVHLYTAEPCTSRQLAKLESAGLDELRFHLPTSSWNDVSSSKYGTVLRNALNTG